MCEPVTIAILGSMAVSAGAAYLSSEAQKDAAESNKNIADMTLDQQKELYGDAKTEILQNNKDLLEYASQQGINIETILKSADTRALSYTTTALNNAKDAELAGNESAAREIVGGIDQAIQSYTPWMQEGEWANTYLKDNADDLTRKFTLDDFEVDPGYQFRLEEGQKAIINNASAFGIGGNTMKDIVDYSQGVASSEYGKAHGRFTDWQKGVTDYYNTIANRGFAATGQVADLQERRGDVLGLEASTKGQILSDWERGTGAVRSQSALNQGNIGANRLAQDVGRRETFTRDENNMLANMATGNANILSNWSANTQAANTQIEQANAGLYTNLANTGTNAIQNYLFMKYMNKPNEPAGYIPGSGGDATQPAQDYYSQPPPQNNRLYDPYGRGAA